MKKIIVGISAADGVQIGVRLLTLLREIPDVETHLVMSRNADTNLRLELGMGRAAAEALADVCYLPEDLAAFSASCRGLAGDNLRSQVAKYIPGDRSGCWTRSGRWPTNGSPRACPAKRA